MRAPSRIRSPSAPRVFEGRTAIGSAIDYSIGVLNASELEADRSVIDISGDGTSNQGHNVDGARDAAIGAGVTINGLAIFNRSAAAQGGYLALHTNPPGGIDKYYRDNVIGGIGSFVIRIDDFNSFEQAMIQKLITEISQSCGRARRVAGLRLRRRPSQPSSAMPANNNSPASLFERNSLSAVAGLAGPCGATCQARWAA